MGAHGREGDAALLGCCNDPMPSEEKYFHRSLMRSETGT